LGLVSEYHNSGIRSSICYQQPQRSLVQQCQTAGRSRPLAIGAVVAIPSESQASFRRRLLALLALSPLALPFAAQGFAHSLSNDSRTEVPPINLDEWKEYRNTVTGLTFKYPATMRARERSASEFGLAPGLVIIDVVGDTPMNPKSIVLRFEV